MPPNISHKQRECIKMWMYAVKCFDGKSNRYLTEYKEWGLGSNSQSWKKSDENALKFSKAEAERIASVIQSGWTHLKYMPYRVRKPIFKAVRKSVK